MKTKENKEPIMVKVPEKVLLSLVAAKLKGRVFFPEKVESMRNHLENIKRFSF